MGGKSSGLEDRVGSVRVEKLETSSIAAGSPVASPAVPVLSSPARVRVRASIRYRASARVRVRASIRYRASARVRYIAAGSPVASRAAPVLSSPARVRVRASIRYRASARVRYIAAGSPVASRAAPVLSSPARVRVRASIRYRASARVRYIAAGSPVASRAAPVLSSPAPPAASAALLVPRGTVPAAPSTDSGASPPVRSSAPRVFPSSTKARHCAPTARDWGFALRWMTVGSCFLTARDWGSVRRWMTVGSCGLTVRDWDCVFHWSLDPESFWMNGCWLSRVCRHRLNRGRQKIILSWFSSIPDDFLS